MARTRATKGAATSSTTNKSQTSSSESKHILSPESPNPPKIFILPQKATSEARVVSLLNPRYNKPTRYLVCPETGIFEFTRIAAPKSTPRSWLIEAGSTQEGADTTTQKLDGQQDGQDFGAYVTKGADLYIATPVDPLFLVLPALAGQSSSKSDKKMFLTSDDHFDTIPKDSSPHLLEILRWGNVRQKLESRMAAVCDTVDAGDESMYRLSEEKLLKELLDKAKRMSKDGLPASMEEKFVAKALEAPVLSVKRETTQSATTSAPGLQTMETQSSTLSTETNTTGVSDASTAATSVAGEEDKAAAEEAFELKPAIVPSPEVISLQRMRVAFSFILSGYVAPSQASSLKILLAEKKSLADFAALDDYLAQVAKFKQEATASRSMADYSRKRILDDDEAAEKAEKKRKKEEEDKRQKAGTSRGVKNLGKVNTTGMKKMSDFFKKK
ncbi:ribonuclease H2, subunit B [Pestalotiopsis sp. NC0098]|nr:ribonuclease H2, subunit B [Pestalotiopsis sp. NC0098]